jgi:hypothetical protein
MAQRDYSPLDRFTHRIAFLNRAVQLSAADVEDVLFSGRFHHFPIERPVFITSLPRAGTTLLLELVSGHPAFASHCYRDMPFIMAPVLWNSISARFRQRAVPREREHGDGVMVGYDSPEAFEEVIWKAFWPDRFRGERAPLWKDEDDGTEFQEFFSKQMQKVISLRSHEDSRKNRYVSKNNGNIGRLGFLKRLFPDCQILVPFRDPVAHASSLRRQHLSFSDIHKREPFSKSYMKDIGHFEFGELHRPISFPGLGELPRDVGADRVEYWMAYWNAAFEHVLGNAERVTLLSYENLCRRGSEGLGVLSDVLGLDDEAGLVAAAGMLRSPRDHDTPTGDLAQTILGRSYELHDRLMGLSVL